MLPAVTESEEGETFRLKPGDEEALVDTPVEAVDVDVACEVVVVVEVTAELVDADVDCDMVVVVAAGPS